MRLCVCCLDVKIDIILVGNGWNCNEKLYRLVVLLLHTWLLINKLSILMTTASASLGTIVVINENNDDSLTAFGDYYITILHYNTQQYSLTRSTITYSRPSDRRYYTVSVSWYSTLLCHLWWQQGKHSMFLLQPSTTNNIATRGGINDKLSKRLSDRRWMI